MPYPTPTAVKSIFTTLVHTPESTQKFFREHLTTDCDWTQYGQHSRSGRSTGGEAAEKSNIKFADIFQTVASHVEKVVYDQSTGEACIWFTVDGVLKAGEKDYKNIHSWWVQLQSIGEGEDTVMVERAWSICDTQAMADALEDAKKVYF